MKIDAEIKFNEPIPSLDISENEIVRIPVDLDYVEDYDDVIGSVENEIYERYGVSKYFNADFIIVNEVEINDELESMRGYD